MYKLWLLNHDLWEFLYGFCLILTKVGTNDLCAKYENNCGNDFLNVALNFLVNF